MSAVPHFDIDPTGVWNDPDPDHARWRKDVPVAFVPQFGAALLTRRDDLLRSEQEGEVLSPRGGGWAFRGLLDLAVASDHRPPAKAR